VKGDKIMFGVIDDEGEITAERAISHAAIANCPHLILVPEHYNGDGSCRCTDRRHSEMATWGYIWNADKGQWTSDEEE